MSNTSPASERQSSLGRVDGATGVKRVLTIALCGNPNAGKSTIFNLLTGLRQKVANYSGVTVESRRGKFVFESRADAVFEIIDIPGCYSLAALSPDEYIAAQTILGKGEGAKPDVAVVVMDAANLDRGLYLYSQIAEAGIPIIAVLNMTDVAEARGRRINVVKLSKILGAPVVSAVANRGRGIDRLREKIGRCDSLPPVQRIFTFDSRIEEFLRDSELSCAGKLSRPELIRALFDRHGPAEGNLRAIASEQLLTQMESLRQALAKEFRGLPFAEAYPLARAMGELASGVTINRPRISAVSERIDKIVLHRFWGPIILVGVMTLLFQSIFSWAAPLIALIGRAVGVCSGAVAAVMSAGALESLIVDGVIGGVGAVIVFVPQLAILFFLLGLLEDSGYLPRAAFIVDRLFRWCGLSGKSFVPLLSSFACAIPGIMATRVIESRRQRFLTIMVAPLMSCSARLPVYALLIAAFVPYRTFALVFNTQGLTLVALYVLGVVVAMIVALVLSRTLLKGRTESFVMELPSYQRPTLRGLWSRIVMSVSSFVKRAGTVIFALTIVVWALSYYPRDPALAQAHEARLAEIAVTTLPAERAAAIHDEENRLTGEYLRHSYFGKAGHVLEPFFAPLGWDWRITMAALASFPAREVVVATLGTIFHLGADVDETSASLTEQMRAAKRDTPGNTPEHSVAAPLFTIPVALSVMVFFALCCQCAATVAAIRRETHSTAWAIGAFTYMTTLAYFGSWLTYSFFSRVL